MDIALDDDLRCISDSAGDSILKDINELLDGNECNLNKKLSSVQLLIVGHWKILDAIRDIQRERNRRIDG